MLLCTIIGAFVKIVIDGKVGDVAAVIIFSGLFLSVTAGVAIYFAMQWQQWALYPDGKLVEMVLGALK